MKYMILESIVVEDSSQRVLGTLQCCLAFGLSPSIIRFGVSTNANKDKGNVGSGKAGNRKSATLTHFEMVNRDGEDVSGPFLGSLMANLVSRLFKTQGASYAPADKSSLRSVGWIGGCDVYFGYFRAQESSQHYLLDLTLLPTHALLLFSRSMVLQTDKRTNSWTGGYVLDAPSYMA